MKSFSSSKAHGSCWLLWKSSCNPNLHPPNPVYHSSTFVPNLPSLLGLELVVCVSCSSRVSWRQGGHLCPGGLEKGKCGPTTSPPSLSILCLSHLNPRRLGSLGGSTCWKAFPTPNFFPFLKSILQAWHFLEILLISHELVHKNVIRTPSWGLLQRVSDSDNSLQNPAYGRALHSPHTEHRADH